MEEERKKRKKKQRKECSLRSILVWSENFQLFLFYFMLFNLLCYLTFHLKQCLQVHFEVLFAILDALGFKGILRSLVS